MGKKFYGIRRGRKRGVYDNWPLAQQQIALYPGAEFRGFNTRAAALAYIDRPDEEIHYIEVHDGIHVTVAALTDKVRAALMGAGLDLNAR